VLPFDATAAAGCAIGALIARRRGGDRTAAHAAGRIAIGVGEDRGVVSVALGGESGSHALIVGATGSGKTVTEALILARAIERGHGAVILDPKGDALLRSRARDQARIAGRAFREWTPSGPAAYNPFAHGTSGEIADKAL